MTSAAFRPTGFMQSYTVPAGVNKVRVDAFGAQGGTAGGGYGGYVSAYVPVTTGQLLYVAVGCGHTISPWNGGGAGSGWGDGTSPGGDASDVRTNSSSLLTRLVVAGGGGGGCGSCEGLGGPGGGLIGGNGADGDWADGALGGTQSAGGRGAGNEAYGDPGTFGRGGSGIVGGGSGYWGGGPADPLVVLLALEAAGLAIVPTATCRTSRACRVATALSS